MTIEHVDVAVLGATGAVGEAILDCLIERKFPLGQVYPLASKRSAGQTVDVGDTAYMVDDAETFDFSKVQLALFSAGSEASEIYAPRAAKAGCVVIDNTSFFRYDDDVPLVVPEVNSEAIDDYRSRSIIANPNCSTIQLAVALKPIYDQVGISRVNVVTYQAVSGAGKRGIHELVNQATHMLNGHPSEPSVFAHPIAFNVIPQIDQFQANGYTREEMKMHWEMKKIFNDEELLVNATAVRVPVLYGHSEAVTIETKEKLSVHDARDCLSSAKGVELIDNINQGDYPTALSHAAGENAVFVGRLREDITNPLGLNLWVVSDNIRKGAALNAVQIAESLVRDHF